MVKRSRPAPLEKRIEFLKMVIEAAERKRESLETRFGALIASDAILLSVIIGIGLRKPTPNNSLDWFQLAITLVSLVSVIFSTYWSVQLLVPFLSQRRRSRIMDVPKDPKIEHNLYLSIRIADLKKNEYRQEISALTEQEIFEQLLSEAHNLSRLLKRRYDVMTRALFAFALGAVAFAILAIVRLFSY